MKILLILPFNTYEGKYDYEVVRRKGGESELPLGIAYLKSYLKTRLPEVEVKLYDSNIDAIDQIINSTVDISMDFLWDRVRNRISNYNPDIVGISVFSHSMAGEAHKVAAICKSLNPDLITVMGGSYPTLSTETVLEDKNVDLVVLSEGEIIFHNLVKAIRNNRSFDSIKGIAYLENGRIRTNQPEYKIKDLDELPYPDLDDLPVEHYGTHVIHSAQRLIEPLKPISMLSSRGCVFNCGFCATKKVWGKVRFRSPREVVDEIKYLKNRYDINFIKINDDLFATDPKRVIEICDLMIKEKPIENWASIGFTVEMLRHREMVDKLIESGHHFFTFSIESGCKKTLKMIKKPMRLEIVHKVIENLRRFKESYVISAFIVGFPFETKDDIQETYDFAASTDLNWAALNFFTPFPKTPLYDYCIESGLIQNKSKLTYTTLQNTNMVSNPHFDRKWLEETKYYHNLNMNFVNNYALRTNNFSTAKTEFLHVLKMVPGHAFAELLAGYAFEKLRDAPAADKHYVEAKRLFDNDTFWQNYLNVFREKLTTRYDLGRILN